MEKIKCLCGEEFLDNDCFVSHYLECSKSRSNDRLCETQLFEGDGLKILPESKEFRFKCCKCALIHRIEIEHDDEGVTLRFYEET